MKKFIIKTLLYLLLLLGTIILTISMLRFYWKKNNLLFVTNSISHNLKAGFIRKNYIKYENAKILILGSSMSLNNINSRMIQDSFGLSTMNLSSWGLKIGDFKDFQISDDKILICNMSFPDFTKPEVNKKFGYPINNNFFTETFNIFFDFETYFFQQSQVRELTGDSSNKDYYNCRFDECGSALFSDSNFKINESRWNFDIHKIDSSSISNFITELKNVIGKKRLILSFSPQRRIFYNQERSKLVSFFLKRLKKNLSNILIINQYDVYYDDKYFVDNYHFNSKGASLFTRQLIDSIKTYTAKPQ